MPDLSLARERVDVNAPLIAWMAVHGAMRLALRHPDIQSVPSAVSMLEQLIEQFEGIFRSSGFMSAAELARYRWNDLEAAHHE